MKTKNVLITTAILSCLSFGTVSAQSIDASPEVALVDAGPIDEGSELVVDAGTAVVPADHPAIVSPDNPIDQAKGGYSAVKGGHWMLAFGFLAMLIGSAGRWLLAKKWDFIETQAGGYIIAISAGLGVLGGGIVEMGGLSMNLVFLALTATFTAMGMHGPVTAALDKVKKAPEA